MKKILLSVLSIAVVGGVAFGATRAFFSDVEKSTGNVLAAGIIDITVDGQNPWTKTFSNKLKDMKPSQTRYIEFTVRNLGNSNDVNLWKHIDITDQSDGVITEPECTEGKGNWTGGVKTNCTVASECCENYTPRNNLAAYTLYDLYVCEDPSVEQQRCLTDEVSGKPTGTGWEAIIREDQYVRLDNVSSAWISLGQLDKGKKLKVVQSYHLSSWPDAPEPEVTNWAQGDELTFDIELMATQLNAPGPEGTTQASLNLENKDPVTWEPNTSDAIGGTLSYNTSGSTFDYSFTGKVPLVSTAYCLIYYADPWPGNGKTGVTGMAIACSSSDSSGNLNLSGSSDPGDLPNVDDQNYPGGAKLWVVLDNDYDNTGHKMSAWNPSNYLFEMNLITYDKTP